MIGRIRRVKQSIQNIILFSVSGVDPSQQLRTSPFACSFPLSPLCGRTGGELEEKKTKTLMDKDIDGLVGEGKNREGKRSE